MAARFWIGGTGTWDAATTTHWSATTGPGTPGASVPGLADTVTFDANSGGGVVTVNTTVAVQQITMGAFTGTLDFSANNNNVTLSANTGLSNTGSGVRTLNLGNGTWTLNGVGTVWNFVTQTNLTFNANSSSIIFAATSASSRTFSVGSGFSYNSVTVNANTGGGSFLIFMGGPTTIATLNVVAPNCIVMTGGVTLTVTNGLNWGGSSAALLALISSVASTSTTISSANDGTLNWAGLRDITFTGGGTFRAANSFDLGHNSGIMTAVPGVAAQPIYQAGI